MLATELRRRKVPKEERELWQGHRRESTNDRYGRFDPDFVATAKSAVEELLLELAAECQTPFSAKFPPSNKKAAPTGGREPLSVTIKMVGATGIEPVTPTMST